MRNQKGVTAIELLLWVAIIGIIAAIAIPALRSVQEGQQKFQQGIADFQVYFGVTPPAGDLNDDQKAVLRPFVSKRLYELSSASTKDLDAVEALKKLPAAQAATEVQERLDALTKASTASKESSENFRRAKYAARLRGLGE